MLTPNCPHCGKEYKPGDEVCQECGLILPFSTDTLTAGTILQGRYEIQELSHIGGMGYIYLAKDKKLYDRLCILKQVKEPVKSDTDLLNKLQEEAMRMARLSHPNVAMILDHFVEGDYYFLVVERISGKTLSEVFAERHGQLKEEEVVSWAISICNVISYIHKEGIIHRDISPDNVMLTDEGIIKFVDFGTLRELRYIATKGTAGMGKFGYTPPEQWQGRPVPQSDIFALGATIYYLLTGSLPLSKEYLSGQGPQRQDFNPKFLPIRTKNLSISTQLEAVVEKALQLDANNRYSSAAEFGQALRSLGKVAVPIQELVETVSQPELVTLRRSVSVEDAKPAPAVARKPISRRDMALFTMVGLLMLAALALSFFPFGRGPEEVDFYTFIEQAKDGQMDTIQQVGNAIIGLKSDKEIVKATFVGSTKELIGTLKEAGIMLGNGGIKFEVKTGGSILRIGVPSPGTAETEPSAPPSLSGGKIAFVSDRDGNWEIYVMNADGSNQTRLTYNKVYDNEPAWSPDGNKIAFASALHNANVGIYVMDVDGSNQTRLTNNQADDWTPAWSPDGNKIAFGSYRDGNREIYIMNADGSNQTRLTNNEADDDGPAWSPDGKKIAFVSDRDKSREIYIMNADGSNQTNLTNRGAWGWMPAWSPDGKKIAFVSVPGKNFQIYVMNADGSNQTRLTNNPADDRYPTWSPDGKKIAFVSDRDGNREIYIMNADGSNQTRLTNNQADDMFPAWSPDGKR